MSDAVAGGLMSERLLSLQTALGQDVLKPVAFRAEEAVSVPFSVTVDAVSDSSSIDADSVLYKPACLAIRYAGKADASPARVIQGLVCSFVASGEPFRGRFAYTLTFVPKLWFMRQTSDCRIFQNVTIADILTTVCGEAGQTLELKIYGDKPAKPYVTQYNETDLAFVSRLLEEAGYYYYFTCDEGDHTLVVTDQNQGFSQAANPTMLVRHEGGGLDTFTTWHKANRTAEGKYRLLDYEPTTPGTLPEGVKPTQSATAGAAGRDVFEWPALATSNDEAAVRARFKMEAAEALAGLCEATSQNPVLAPGTRFTLGTDPFGGSDAGEYVVRGVTSTGQDRGWITGDEQASFSNQLVAFKSTVQWREKMATPRPVMGGVHTAVVLGNAGEEIHADEYGRVKIRFFWDHRQDAKADSACWARVVQPWAGNTWGWQHLPRVGTEVAVAFMDGDPDRPVVMGGFYNGDMMPVFAIPGEQTKSGFRSRSTTQGGTSTFSELSFDDKKGDELVLLHAEKDMTVEVENDQTVTVDHDRKLTVKHQETIEVDDSQTVTIKNGRTTTIEASGDTLTVKNGDIAIEASLGSISMQAMNSIELMVGPNKITIDNTGVTVSATQVKLQGKTMAQVQAPMTQVSGDGMLTLKGGVMMLN